MRVRPSLWCATITAGPEHLSAPRRGENTSRVPAPGRRCERPPLAADQLGPSRIQANRQVQCVVVDSPGVDDDVVGDNEGDDCCWCCWCCWCCRMPYRLRRSLSPACHCACSGPAGGKALVSIVAVASLPRSILSFQERKNVPANVDGLHTPRKRVVRLVHVNARIADRR